MAQTFSIGLGDTAKNYFKMNILTIVNLDNFPNKYAIIFKFKDRFLIQSEGCGFSYITILSLCRFATDGNYIAIIIEILLSPCPGFFYYYAGVKIYSLIHLD